MQELATIYKFNDPVEYLNFEFKSKCIKNKSFSLRAWSRQLGYENPSFLSHILKKERSLKIETAEKFIRNLNLKGDEKKYFELLVMEHNCKKADQKKLYWDILESLRPKNKRPPQSLNIELFRMISDWYHTAILELIGLSDFQYDVEWIRVRLGNEVSAQNIKNALQRLLKLKLIEELTPQKLARVKDNPLLVESYIPSEAIRYFHKQMIEKAQNAIEGQNMKDRDIRGSMISIRLSDYEKIQQIITKAHQDIVKFSFEANGEEIYQLNTQFFRITNPSEEI